MANLLHQKWFKPALLALLVILQLALLFTTTFLRPPFTESEDAYLLLAQAPVAESTADGAQAVLLDENAHRSIVAELDWLYRPIAAGKGFALERMGDDAARTVLIMDETGEVRSVQLPEGAGPLLGGDARYVYLWDSAEPDAAGKLLALDLETLEIVNRFE